VRLVRFAHDSDTGIGVRVDGGVVATGYGDLRSFIADGETALATACERTAQDHPFEVDAILAPLPNPGKMLFCGLTHRSLRDELGGGERLTEHPYVYAKLPHTIIGPGEPIVIPSEDTHAAWEVELGVIVGKDARNITEQQALDHVFGYTVLNDVTAMDEFVRSLDTWTCPMTLLKNYETFCPMGPEVVLTDELPDPDQLAQRTIVNGEVRQDGSMADCWYTVAEIITWLSTRMPLHAGDLISTGTPPGIERMHPGDEVVCEIARIGRLANPVVAGWEP
jgi:2-keto-4-pentenoate hydratase/2-oxohepta-3-ene-1,7-dioic acid hydratase in catechol pathway